jgi:hypothetical protein
MRRRFGSYELDVARRELRVDGELRPLEDPEGLLDNPAE